jgi:hypothetical protein
VKARGAVAHRDAQRQAREAIVTAHGGRSRQAA